MKHRLVVSCVLSSLFVPELHSGQTRQNHFEVFPTGSPAGKFAPVVGLILDSTFSHDKKQNIPEIRQHES